MIHWTSVFDACRSVMSDGIATLRIVLSITMITSDMHSTASVIQRRRSPRSTSTASVGWGEGARLTGADPFRYETVQYRNRKPRRVQLDSRQVREALSTVSTGDLVTDVLDIEKDSDQIGSSIADVDRKCPNGLTARLRRRRGSLGPRNE